MLEDIESVKAACSVWPVSGWKALQSLPRRKMPPPPQTWDPPRSMLRSRLPLQLRTSVSLVCFWITIAYISIGYKQKMGITSLAASVDGKRTRPSVILPYRSFK